MHSVQHIMLYKCIFDFGTKLMKHMLTTCDLFGTNKANVHSETYVHIHIRQYVPEIPLGIVKYDFCCVLCSWRHDGMTAWQHRQTFSLAKACVLTVSTKRRCEYELMLLLLLLCCEKKKRRKTEKKNAYKAIFPFALRFFYHICCSLSLDSVVCDHAA